MDECIYSRTEVCQMLGISIHALDTWYRWQNRLLRDGLAEKEYLPKPERVTNLMGQPSRWSMDMVGKLKVFKSGIIRGRKGIYGIYSNLVWLVCFYS